MLQSQDRIIAALAEVDGIKIRKQLTQRQRHNEFSPESHLLCNPDALCYAVAPTAKLRPGIKLLLVPDLC